MNNKKLKNVVVIDIDAGSVKVILGNVNKDAISIKKVASSLLPENVFLDGKILNQEILESMIKNLLRVNKIKSSQCFCTFESSQMITREVLVPNSPGSNFQEIAKFEVAQFLPIEIKNYVVQSKQVREVDVDGKPFIEALTTAVPKQMVDQMHQMLQNAGLKPTVLDSHGNSIAKLFESQIRVNEEVMKNKTIAFIEFGFESMFVSIFQNGKFKLSRLILRGSKELDANISRFFQITTEESASRRMKIHNLMDTSEVMNDESRLNNVVRSSMESWFDEIDKTFRYYASRNKGFENIEHAFLYGPITQINGMPGFFQSYTRIPTENIKKIENIDWPTTTQESNHSDYYYAVGTMYRK